ncbi:flagellar basal-body rod protein FlgB [Pirellula staleyi DSM 6068]|uniref:Flagellar basal body rod protein FlgB n=1 Tax=Pirellula staleyi (strain ATCC 27377 / DSM 6068 / ICPB 4128) TaxID=530564 RepID=D2R522_PIRSD|nr:flagellar basal body rod protein FlgB [Pirellula staleyi]ADB18984.1 flagellar basal-body rod protein FlgB [Pirellula staleyi DSM 6068]
MLPGLLNSTNIPALAEVLNFAQARHGVLVSNVANINTPGYRTRDLSVSHFQEKLKEAMEVSQSTGSSISPGIVSADPGDPMRSVRASMDNILYHDDTNIDLEKQVAEINKNQMLHNIALTIMTDQFELLQQAISERV